MARYGRGVPPSTSQFTAALLQTPLAGVMSATLPTPMVMAATAAVGVNANMVATLPTPMQMLSSAQVAVGNSGDFASNLPTPLQFSATATVGGVVVQPTGLWSSTDLLARCKFYAQRPTADESMADTDWYSLLTEAQAHWTRVIAAQIPQALFLPPQQLTSTDGGFTYTFGTDPDGNPINPIALELQQSPTGRPWFAGANFDQSGDFVWEGDRIRFYGQRARPMSNGPWARYVLPSGTLNAATQPTLKPPHARILIVLRAVSLWAIRGGFRDPTPFQVEEKRTWNGDPASGDVGVLGALKMAYWTYGSEAVYGAGAQGAWWTSIPSGLGYQGTAP